MHKNFQFETFLSFFSSTLQKRFLYFWKKSAREKEEYVSFYFQKDAKKKENRGLKLTRRFPFLDVFGGSRKPPCL